MITGPTNPTQALHRRSMDSAWPLVTADGITFAQRKQLRGIADSLARKKVVNG
jgi:hypothetical protein